MDISDPQAAKIIDDLLREYAGLFPGKYWHLGGDEYLALAKTGPGRVLPRAGAKAREEFGPRAGVQDLAAPGSTTARRSYATRARRRRSGTTACTATASYASTRTGRSRTGRAGRSGSAAPWSS